MIGAKDWQRLLCDQKKRGKILVQKCRQQTAVIWTFNFYKNAHPNWCIFDLKLKHHELRHLSEQDEIPKNVLRNLRFLSISGQRLEQRLCPLYLCSPRAFQQRVNSDSTSFFSLLLCTTFHFAFLFVLLPHILWSIFCGLICYFCWVNE